MEHFTFNGYNASYDKNTGELLLYDKLKGKRELKSYIRQGYRIFILMVDGKKHNYTAHRIIAQQFIPNVENKREVDHINRNRLDNRLINLRWATKSENMRNRDSKGYYYQKRCKLWRVLFYKQHGGYFKTEEEARQKAEEMKAQH